MNRPMLHADWEILFHQYKKPWKRIHMLQDIENRKYYEGFKVGREKKMFEEELKDIELTYKGALVDINKQVEDCLPSLLHYMEEFVNLHKNRDAVSDKLAMLLAKTGRQNEEDDEDEDE